ncbi:MAG: hypothetical protein P8P99_02085 [Maricaulis sp.]|nr:hypothetical protein [Maricaulis sp.]
MPRQNRITPFGEIVAHSARGTLMGNRGCLHNEHGQLGQRRWGHQAWVLCVLEYRGWHREIMTPNRYTELFFTDDAVALAAGHRPCGTCRRADYQRFREAFGRAHQALPAPASPQVMNRALHADRVDSRTRRQITYSAQLSTLPDGVFFCLRETEPALVMREGQTFAWSFGGYQPVLDPIDQTVTVLTPKGTVEAIRAGYTVSFNA